MGNAHGRPSTIGGNFPAGFKKPCGCHGAAPVGTGGSEAAKTPGGIGNLLPALPVPNSGCPLEREALHDEGNPSPGKTLTSTPNWPRRLPPSTHHPQTPTRCVWHRGPTWYRGKLHFVSHCIWGRGLGSLKSWVMLLLLLLLKFISSFFTQEIAIT